MHDTPPCTLVIFGASGDLTRRKLIPALWGLHHGGYLPAAMTVIGYGRSAKTDAIFRREMREAFFAMHAPNPAESEGWALFESRLRYVSGAYDSVEDLNRLHAAIRETNPSCTARTVLYDLALPPSASEHLLRAFHASSLPRRGEARIMMEKPFGTDLASAKRLNERLGALFDETEIHRVDHYLAKDTVRNLLTLRFANAIFEPLWNRHYIDHIRITAAEAIGVEGRGGYYEEAGVVRDMLQNHVLQILALIAMEPPLAGDAESVRDKKSEIFKAIPPLAPGDCVFGQYEGYRDERGVAPDSSVPTFVAARLEIENWRWKGVPFYLRSGKALARKVTEVAIRFRQVPLCVLADPAFCPGIRPNCLLLRIQPDEGISLRINVERPGHAASLAPADLAFPYASFGDRPGEAYERVILDAMRGSPTLFWRSDGIEAAWRVVEPILDPPAGRIAYPNYAPGTWGPAEAEALLRREGRAWNEPGEV